MYSVCDTLSLQLWCWILFVAASTSWICRPTRLMTNCAACSWQPSESAARALDSLNLITQREESEWDKSVILCLSAEKKILLPRTRVLLLCAFIISASTRHRVADRLRSVQCETRRPVAEKAFIFEAEIEWQRTSDSSTNFHALLFGVLYSALDLILPPFPSRSIASTASNFDGFGKCTCVEWVCSIKLFATFPRSPQSLFFCVYNSCASYLVEDRSVPLF